MVDYNKESVDGTISSIAAQLKADDGSFRVAVVVRDKQRPYDEPTAIRAMNLEDVRTFVTNIPDQVHYLVLSKEDKSALLKVSMSSKTGSFNVFCDAKSIMSKTFNEELLLGVSDKFAPELVKDWKLFLEESEEV